MAAILLLTQQPRVQIIYKKIVLDFLMCSAPRNKGTAEKREQRLIKPQNVKEL